MRIKWPFFWVFMVNYGHLRIAVISKQFRVQTHIWSGLKRSIIFIFSFNKSSKKSRNYAVYEMMLKWSFFLVFMVNYGHLQIAVISKRFWAQMRGFHHWIGIEKLYNVSYLVLKKSSKKLRWMVLELVEDASIVSLPNLFIRTMEFLDAPCISMPACVLPWVRPWVRPSVSHALVKNHQKRVKWSKVKLWNGHWWSIRPGLSSSWRDTLFLDIFQCSIGTEQP